MLVLRSIFDRMVAKSTLKMDPGLSMLLLGGRHGVIFLRSKHKPCSTPNPNFLLGVTLSATALTASHHHHLCRHFHRLHSPVIIAVSVVVIVSVVSVSVAAVVSVVVSMVPSLSPRQYLRRHSLHFRGTPLQFSPFLPSPPWPSCRLLQRRLCRCLHRQMPSSPLFHCRRHHLCCCRHRCLRLRLCPRPRLVFHCYVVDISVIMSCLPLLRR